MVNQSGAGALWKRTRLRLGGRNVFAMSVRGNDARDHFARLVTPPLSPGGATAGCLRFSYFVDGLSPASLASIKQGYVTRYVFATARKTQDHWAQARVDVRFLGDALMFYFEADTRVQEFGDSIVAFTDLRITDRPCSSTPEAKRSLDSG